MNLAHEHSVFLALRTNPVRLASAYAGVFQMLNIRVLQHTGAQDPSMFSAQVIVKPVTLI